MAGDKEIFSVEKKFKVEFYDVDSMDIVYHGNYVKFLEVGRCALLDEIGYNYLNMREDGYSFPVVDLRIKYVKSLHFNEVATIRSSITEFENCLKIKYVIMNSKGETVTKAETTQMAVRQSDGESLFVCPSQFVNLVKAAAARCQC